jgi:D-alanine transaminase
VDGDDFGGRGGEGSTDFAGVWGDEGGAIAGGVVFGAGGVSVSALELAGGGDCFVDFGMLAGASVGVHAFSIEVLRATRRCGMNDLIWLNGEILPMSEARISPEDRGFQFADGVYEVIRLYNGRPFTLDEHLGRLERSAAELKLTLPISIEKLKGEIGRLIDESRAGEGMIYLQLTRGHAPRNHLFPPAPGSTLLFYARALEPLPSVAETPAVKLMTAADDRWNRCWVKSIALLPNVLAKNAAVAAGADEAVFVENGRVSECSASNFFAVIGGRVVTCPVGPKVLPGITRGVLLEIARELGIGVEERAMTEAEARGADELFITSTTRVFSPFGVWVGAPVGRSSEVTRRLHRGLKERVGRETR